MNDISVQDKVTGYYLLVKLIDMIIVFIIIIVITYAPRGHDLLSRNDVCLFSL